MRKLFLKEITSAHAIIMALIISLLYVYPTINAGVYYIDDLARSQTGYLGWSVLGRPLSDYIFYIFTFGGNSSVDISPLPQLLSIVFMAISIKYLSINLFKEITIASILCSSLVFITPLFLHNIIYKYDSLSMVLSLSSCIYSAFYKNKNSTIEFSVKTLLLVASLCLYQVSATAFIMLISISYAFNYSQKKTILISRLFKDLLVIFASYCIYLIILKTTATTSRSETIFGYSNWFNLLEVNITKFINMYLNAYSSTVIAIILFSMCIAILIYSYSVYKYWKSYANTISRLISLLLITLPLLLLLASMITIIVLKESLILPRIATTFGIITLYIACIIYSRFKLFAGFFSFILIFYTITTSFALSASTADQFTRDTFLINDIKNTIMGNNTLSSSKTTTFGIAKESYVANINSKHFPAVRMINSRVYDGTASVMLTRYGLDGVNFSFDRKTWMKKALSVCEKNEAVIKNIDFSIYNENKQNYVFLGNPPSSCK
ncbi:TPA: glucosyltransferase domain-containing protein [Pseudomonas aeruginosa]